MLAKVVETALQGQSKYASGDNSFMKITGGSRTYAGCYCVCDHRTVQLFQSGF